MNLDVVSKFDPMMLLCVNWAIAFPGLGEWLGSPDMID
jgi:hypothetical protein